MYKNSFNKRLEKDLKAYMVYCDRGDIAKATLASKDVFKRTNELLNYTVERMQIKKDREVVRDTAKAKPQTESRSDTEKPAKDEKRVGRPSKAVQSGGV